jgi:DNA sulfur modification protein DndC
MALDRVLGIQAEVNSAARRLGRPPVSLINDAEEARIRELLASETWPDGWDGDEPTGDTVMETIYQNGAVQPLLFSADEAN